MLVELFPAAIGHHVHSRCTLNVTGLAAQLSSAKANLIWWPGRAESLSVNSDSDFQTWTCVINTIQHYIFDKHLQIHSIYYFLCNGQCAHCYYNCSHAKNLAGHMYSSPIIIAQHAHMYSKL